MRFDLATHEHIVAGERHDLQRTLMTFSLGTGPHFNRKDLAVAVMSWRALVFMPSTAVMIHVGGYDQDPRELWQIPEAREFIRKFCEKTKAHENPAIDPMSRALLLACGADPNRYVDIKMISREEALRQSQAFFKSRIGDDDSV